MRWGPVSKKQPRDSQKSAHLWQKKSCRLCYTSISLWKKCSLQPRRPPRELPGINEFKAVAARETASLSSPLLFLFFALFSPLDTVWKFGTAAESRRRRRRANRSLPSVRRMQPQTIKFRSLPPSLLPSHVSQPSEQAASRTVRLAHPQLRPQRQHNFLEGRISRGITSTDRHEEEVFTRRRPRGN